jgi:hypothetical protein
MMSSRVRGRSRAARGARADRRSAAAPENRSSSATAPDQSFVGTGCRPRSASTRGATGLGASVIGSDPDWVFGKAMTSRMLSSPAKMAVSRSIPTAKPGVGRSTVSEGAEQEPEPRREPPRRLIPSTAKTRLWMSARWITDAARAELPPVEDQVVGLGAHRCRVGLQAVEVVGVGHGERMVGGDRVAPASSTPSNIGKSTTHRYSYGPLGLTGRPPSSSRSCTEHGTQVSRYSSATTRIEVAHRRGGVRHQSGPLVVGEELGHRRVDGRFRRLSPSTGHPEPGQALGPQRLGLDRSGRRAATG